MRKTLIAAARALACGMFIALGWLTGAMAQSGPQSGSAVQQVGTRLDAATAAAVGTNYNTVNSQSVMTIAPPAGQCVYITRIELEAIQDGTATAAVNSAFTTTGLGSGATAAPQWGFSLAATADITLYRDINFGASPLKSASCGTNVTITSPTAATHLAFGIKAYYYLAP